MGDDGKGLVRAALIWVALAGAVAVPIAAAAASPLLQWRGPVYITAGFAGVIALALMLLQPLLAAGYLPAFSPYQARRVHRWVGTALVAAVALHIGGLWITSPPDVIDALLFSAPTAFSAWGVVAMWGVFAVAVLVGLRHRLGVRPRVWRRAHKVLVSVIVVSTAVHCILIEGTMETVSKVALCTFVLAATLKAVAGIRVSRKRAATR